MSKHHKQLETDGRLSRRRGRSELAAWVGIVFALLATSSAMADQAWWTGLAGSAWNAGLTNWNTDATGGTVVSALPSSGTDVFFSTLLPVRQSGSPTLGTDSSINSLTFTSRDGALSLGDSAHTLTLAGSGGSGITVEGGSATRSIVTDILLGAPQIWTNNGATAITTLSVSGDIDATTPSGQLTIAGSGNTSLAGTVGSNITGGLVKTGGGVLSLDSIANSFSGGLTINGGVVQATDGRALGAVGSGVTLNSGGTLNLQIPGYTEMTLGAGRCITVNGSASNPSGLEVAGLLTTGPSQLQGNGTLRVSSSYPPSGGTTGELDVTGACPRFTGQIVIGAGKQLIGDYFSEPFGSNSVDIIVRLVSTGSLANAAGITVTQTGTLAISQSGAAVTARLGSAPLTFHSGRFTYSTNAIADAAINDTFGNVAVTGQWKIVGFANGAGPAGGTTLNFGNLNRADHATLLFLDGGLTFGGSASSLRIFFANLVPDTTTSGLTRSVIPWAGNAPSSLGAPNDLMTYDANGFRPLDVATETTPTLTAGANVWSASGTITIPTGGLSINSLSLSGFLQGSATTTAPGNVLTITSGGVAGSLNLRNAAVNFPNGAYVHTASSSTVTGASRITGSGGLAVSSKGSLQFTNTPAEGNTFTGGLFINDSASISFTANNQLGNDASGHASGSIVLGGGSLFYAPNLSTDTVSLSDGGINRSIFVNESGGFIAGSQGILGIPGTISGPGQLQIGTDDGQQAVIDLTQSAGNTYTGGTVVRRGTLRISNPNQLGTGSLALNSGTLQPVGNLALPGTLQIGRSSAIDLQLGNLTLTGGVNGSSNVATAGGTPASVILITTAGTGTLTIDGNSNFGGRLYDFAGHMLVKGLMSGTASVTIWSAGTFELGASYRLSSSTILTLFGGIFATGGLNEDLGAMDMLAGSTPASIDLGDGSSRLTLADSHLEPWSGTLEIENWTGSPTGSGTDQIFFGASASGLTASQLAEITFVDPDGYAPGNYAAQLLPTGELVAVVPEPGSFALALCGGISLAALRRRERR